MCVPPSKDAADSGGFPPQLAKIEDAIKAYEGEDRHITLSVINIEVITEKVEPGPTDMAVVRRDTGKRILTVHYINETAK